MLGRDRERFVRRHILVVGMGHSAADTSLALVRLRESERATRLTWAIRGRSPARLYGGGDADGLPARGLLGSRLKAAVLGGGIVLLREVTIGALNRATDRSGRLTVRGTAPETDNLALDVVVAAAIGFRPDLSLLREVRLDLDPALEAPARLAPMIDPNLHSRGTVPPHGESVLTHSDTNLYLVGMKSYGRASTFLLAAALAGDTEAATRTQLDLPEAGVCSTDLAAREDADDGQLLQTAAVGFATGGAHGHSGEMADGRSGRTPPEQPEQPVDQRVGSCCGSTRPSRDDEAVPSLPAGR